jgi:hypothetical protein
MDQAQTQQQAMHMMAIMGPIMLIGWVIIMVILIIPLWKISQKAGLSGPLSLLTLIPGVGLLIALYVVAFADWKVVPTANLVAYPPQPYPPAGYPPQGPAI